MRYLPVFLAKLLLQMSMAFLPVPEFKLLPVLHVSQHPFLHLIRLIQIRASASSSYCKTIQRGFSSDRSPTDKRLSTVEDVMTAPSHRKIIRRDLSSDRRPTDECLSSTEDVMTASVSSDLVQGLATRVNANSLAILHDCKPNRSDVHSAGPTAALPVPSLHAVPVTMSAPHCIMSSPSLKLFQSGIISDFVDFGADSDRGGTLVSADYVTSGVDSEPWRNTKVFRQCCLWH